MNTSQPIPIAIIDDHTLFRQGLISLLSEFPELDIIFEASDGRDMQQRFSSARAVPEVILMDITMPVMDGFAATAWVRQHYPEMHILALSMREDDKAIIRMLRSGAGGYLLKESKALEVLNAIKTIREHGHFLNDLVTLRLLRNLQNNATSGAGLELSNNELKFLQLCCSELTYKEIADQMNLSPHTIDNYRQEIFQRFHIKSRTGLVLFALRNELISL
ncbi:response regulator transcription factor [Chitinophaga sp. sic0106]|uniref:response regulator transcription factor n=1 Tax=Chitinophaga sp. sic0106 TaxID=2854785 RepID=UPI001C46D81F|nr:response regulator transcription factor [Chitinophaga sp. sic0106]MBV7532189.1 response regulator transcription factor [Chitinophaga sp. sic0106]